MILPELKITVTNAIGRPIAEGIIQPEWLQTAIDGGECSVRCDPYHEDDPYGVRFLRITIQPDT